MKKLFFILVLMTISICSFSQNIAINATGTPPVASAILDVSSNSKGILIPRMTTAQCGAIVTPASGLLIYDTDKKTFMYYNGTSWLDIASAAANNGWKIQGNSGTSSATNFIGTSDNVPLVFKTNNVQSAFLDPISGNNYFGPYAGVSNVSGVGNVAMGTEALRFNLSGVFNTAIGTESLSKNTTGLHNAALGTGSLYNNTGGNENSAFGFHALWSNTTGATNIAVGNSSLFTNTDGQSNIAIGHEALYSNINGSGNTSIGAGSLYNNTIGTNNIAIGSNTMRANLSGFFNMASGISALYSNTTGSNNTAAGTSAMHDNISGYSNVAIGKDALYRNTIKSNTVAVGDSSLRSNGLNASVSFHSTKNTAIGSKVLMDNTTGYANTALGFESLSNNTTGFKNTAIGVHALLSSTIGSRNTAVGDSTMYLNVNGASNTAVGSKALQKNTTGNSNNAFGRQALGSNQTGSDNTAIGHFALAENTDGIGNTGVGNLALNYGTTGDYNTGIGISALSLNYTGNKNTGIGYNANVFVTGLNYATAIGADAVVHCSNCMVLGGTGSASTFVGINTNFPDADMVVKQKSDVTGNNSRGLKLMRNTGAETFWRVYTDGMNLLTFEYNNQGDGNWGYINTSGEYVNGSDVRIKKDISPLSGSLDKIKQLSAKTYHYLNQDSNEPVHIGFIAQELETVYPEMVNTRENGTKGIAYQQLAPVAIEAIKEQQVIIEDLQRQINELRAIVQKD